MVAKDDQARLNANVVGQMVGLAETVVPSGFIGARPFRRPVIADALKDKPLTATIESDKGPRKDWFSSALDASDRNATGLTHSLAVLYSGCEPVNVEFLWAYP